jgi:probable addiction module antidote protein
LAIVSSDVAILYICISWESGRQRFQQSSGLGARPASSEFINFATWAVSKSIDLRCEIGEKVACKRPLLLSKLMSAKRIKPVIGPASSRDEMAAYISDALATSDIVRISQAIRDVILLRGVADVAKRSGVQRQSLYRAFQGKQQYPNFTTVLNVMGSMGLQLRVVVREGAQNNRTTEQAER